MTRAQYAIALHLCEKGGATLAELTAAIGCTEPTVRTALATIQAARVWTGRAGYRYLASPETWRIYRDTLPMAAPAPRPYRSIPAAVRALLREGNLSAAEIARRSGYHVHCVGKHLRKLAARGDVVRHQAGPKSVWILCRRAA